jgi:DNA-binding response OmpR family regulator
MMKDKVLIVEDDNDLRFGLTRRLAALGYDVVQAVDGYQAVAVAIKENPDVVLLDIGLPAGDGISVLRRFEQLPALWFTPVVALTGRDPSTTESVVRAFAGVSAFLRKPADNDELAAALADAIRGAQQAATPPGIQA